MRVLFIFWANPGDLNSSTLTHELAEEFGRQGHQVTAVIPLEKKYNLPTHTVQEKYYDALYIKTGNFFNLDSKLEKVITVFTISKALLNGIMNHLAQYKFDLIITRAPFLGDPKLIQPLKKHFNCPAYLLLYDIFPQTAWDMGIIKSRLVYQFFKYQEKKMLSAFSVIWCTSPGNAKYILAHHKNLEENQVEWLYHYAVIKPMPQINKHEIRRLLGYTDTDFIAIFGGNMGLPQKLENILALARKTKPLTNVKFLFIGTGTEKTIIQGLANSMKLDNVQFIEYLPREKYELMIASCDIGIVSLNQNFTVPNFPSKTTDYFKVGLPILASLDSSAANDYGKLLQDKLHAGFYAIAGNLEQLYIQFIKLYNDPEARQIAGENGRRFYEQELDVSHACKKIVNKFLQETVKK